MSGAGSLTATNYMAKFAAKDDSVIALARAPVMELLAGTSSSAFDPLKLTWIGNGAAELTMCGIPNNPNVRTLTNAQKTPFILAGLGPGSDEDKSKYLQDFIDYNNAEDPENGSRAEACWKGPNHRLILSMCASRRKRIDRRPNRLPFLQIEARRGRALCVFLFGRAGPKGGAPALIPR